MFNEEIMKKKPKQGYGFIYRYFDEDGSYIGQTRQSLFERANHGKGYTSGKWAEVIEMKGFDSFQVEILEECPINQLNEKEIYWIKEFNSAQCGYNSTIGGTNNRSSTGVGPMPEMHKQLRLEFIQFLQNGYKIRVLPTHYNADKELLQIGCLIENKDAKLDINNSFFFHLILSKEKYRFNNETLRFEFYENTPVIVGTVSLHLCGRSSKNWTDHPKIDDMEILTDELKKELLFTIDGELSAYAFSNYEDEDNAKISYFASNIIYSYLFGKIDNIKNIAPLSMLIRFDPIIEYSFTAHHGEFDYTKCYIYLEGIKDFGYHIVFRSDHKLTTIDDDDPILSYNHKNFIKQITNYIFDAIPEKIDIKGE